MARPNRGLRLEKNDAGIYEIRWSEAGRSKRVSTRTSDAAEAADALRIWRHGQRQQAEVATAGTCRGVLDAYFREVVYPKVQAQGTAEIARKHLLAHFADMVPAELMPADSRDYAKLRMAGRIGRPVQGSTVRRELGVLIAALNHAVAEKRLARADMPPVPLPESNPPRDRWLADDELRRLLDAAAAPAADGRLTRAHRFVFLAYYTAGRKRAIETLKWDQVDWGSGARGAVNLEAAGRRRSKKRRAKVPMTAALRALLERAFTERGSEWVLDHPGNIRRTFESAVSRAGLDDVTPHVLRHTAATHMLRRGISDGDVADVLGDTVATVRRVYGHHVPDNLRTAVEALL